ncbi:conserved Plasmodium protein, unknown function [Plasmodium gallinaceum]|uniref:Uncharacterized protein n=1 Tax=Plasmodium gallinaceum TaxID=5849 RepID=A0A1J1GQJ0_PLAGA|nr:conserved Plasmodium protein, unknown function [Plasmodium gallinaceum]CRG93551.1 conserved Plasmodium protein, unknown function [Plasmodium gallinaceum]
MHITKNNIMNKKDKIKKDTKIKIKKKINKKKINLKSFKNYYSSSNESDIYFYNDIQRWKNNIKVPIWLKKPKDRESLDEFYKNIIRKLLRVKNKIRAYKIQEAYLIDCLQKCMSDLNLNSVNPLHFGDYELYRKLIYNNHTNSFSENEKLTSDNEDKYIIKSKYFSNNKISDESTIFCDESNHFNKDITKEFQDKGNCEINDININKYNIDNYDEINKYNRNNSNNNDDDNCKLEINRSKSSSLNTDNINNGDSNLCNNNYNGNNDTKSYIKSTSENDVNGFIYSIKNTLLKVYEKKKKNNIMDDIFSKVIIPGAFFENNNFCPIFMKLLKLDIYNTCCSNDIKLNSKLMDLFKMLNSFNDINIENKNKNEEKENGNEVKKKVINDESYDNLYKEDLSFFKSQSSLYKLSQYCIEKNIIVNNEIVSFDTIYIYNEKNDETKSKNFENNYGNKNCIAYNNRKLEYILGTTKKKNPSLHYIHNKCDIIKKDENINIIESTIKSCNSNKQNYRNFNESNKNTNLKLFLYNKDHKNEKKNILNENNSDTIINLSNVMDSKELYEISSRQDEVETYEEINTSNSEYFYENKNKGDKFCISSKNINEIEKIIDVEHENNNESNNDLDLSEKNFNLLFSNINKSATDENEYSSQDIFKKKGNICSNCSSDIKDINEKNCENVLNKENIDVSSGDVSEKLINHDSYNNDDENLQNYNPYKEKSIYIRDKEINKENDIDDQNYIIKDSISKSNQENNNFSFQSIKLKNDNNDKNENECKKDLDKFNIHYKDHDNLSSELLKTEEEIEEKKIIDYKLKNYEYIADDNIKNSYYKNENDNNRTNENDDCKIEMNEIDNNSSNNKSCCGRDKINIDNKNKNNILINKNNIIINEDTYNKNSQNEDSRSFKTCEDSDSSIFISVKKNYEKNKKSSVINKKDDSKFYNKEHDSSNSLKSCLCEKEEDKNDNKNKKIKSTTNIHFFNEDVNEKNEIFNNCNLKGFLEETSNNEVIILDDDISINAGSTEVNNSNKNELKKESLKSNFVSDKQQYVKNNNNNKSLDKEKMEFYVLDNIDSDNLCDKSKISINKLNSSECLIKTNNTDIYEKYKKKNKKKGNINIEDKKESELSILNIDLNKANNVILEGLMEFFGLKSKRLSRKIIINELKKIQDYLNEEYDKLLKDKEETVVLKDHIASHKESSCEDNLCTNSFKNSKFSYNYDVNNNSNNMNIDNDLKHMKKRKFYSERTSFKESSNYPYNDLLESNQEKLQDDYINHMRTKIRKMELKSLFERIDEAISINDILHKNIHDEKKIEYSILKKYLIDCKLNVNKEILLSYAKDKNIDILFKKKKSVQVI